MTSPVQNLLAIEVGSSRVKLGWFPSAGACTSDKPMGALPIAAPPLPEPAEVFRIEHQLDEDQWTAEIEARLDEWPAPRETVCIVAVVHQAAAETLQRRTLAARQWSRIVTLSRDDIPIRTDVKDRARVGIDRLLNALAVNRVRPSGRPAIVLDMGTAMTVNLISSDGRFQGGAILAGPVTALRALNGATSSLPLLGPEVFDQPPPVVGKSTEEAMASGAYWGAVGAARQLIERMAEVCNAPPEVFITGGASRGVAPLVGWQDRPARYMPRLVLSGIRLAAEGMPWE
jgi:type III pantothenate kinase